MNRHERRKAKVAGVYPVKPEHYSKTTANGLMQIDVVFGMVRQPRGGEPEVREAFREVAEALRGFADNIERANASAPKVGVS